MGRPDGKEGQAGPDDERNHSEHNTRPSSGQRAGARRYPPFQVPSRIGSLRDSGSSVELRGH